MQKNKFLFLFQIAVALLILTSCNTDKNNSKEKVTTDVMVYDSLPDAKWNGEYLKIEDKEENKKKGKQSLGSDYYSMGEVKFIIHGKEVDFTIFEKKKNLLTFTNQRINAYIKSAFDENVKIQLRKNEIIQNYKGIYQPGNVEIANNTVVMVILLNNENEEYTLTSGKVEMIEFNPRLANLELKFKGDFVNEKQEKVAGEGTIKMRFEEAIMTEM